MAESDERIQTPRTVHTFARTLAVHLPRQLATMRRLGRLTRALPGQKAPGK